MSVFFLFFCPDPVKEKKSRAFHQPFPSSCSHIDSQASGNYIKSECSKQINDEASHEI